MSFPLTNLPLFRFGVTCLARAMLIDVGVRLYKFNTGNGAIATLMVQEELEEERVVVDEEALLR
jgi:hypothetical protein